MNFIKIGKHLINLENVAYISSEGDSSIAFRFNEKHAIIVDISDDYCDPAAALKKRS